jgi:hypothetical protein
MNDKQITITGSLADLAAFLNSLSEDAEIHLQIDSEASVNPEGGDADGTDETDG